MLFWISGFTDFRTSCCPMKSDGFCIPDSIPCSNRSNRIFYDGIRTTEAANNYTASFSYDSTDNPQVTYPMDVKRLAQLDLQISKSYMSILK